MKLEQCWTLYRDNHLEPVAIDATRAEKAWARLRVHFAKIDHTDVRQRVADYRNARLRESIAPGTINRELGVLASALRWCWKNGHIEAVPYIARGGESKIRERILSQSEIDRLIKASKKRPHIYLFVMLALMTAQRVSAILKLRWDQVNLEQGYIDFNDHTDIRQKRRKGRGVVPITDGLATILEKAVRKDASHVLTLYGFPLTTIRWAWAATVDEAGLPGVTPHTLRHTAASIAMNKGAPLEQVSRLLGHKNIRTTQRVYVKYDPLYARQAADKLDFLK